MLMRFECGKKEEFETTLARTAWLSPDLTSLHGEVRSEKLSLEGRLSSRLTGEPSFCAGASAGVEAMMEPGTVDADTWDAGLGKV